MSRLFQVMAKFYDPFMDIVGLSHDKLLSRLVTQRGMQVADIGGGTGTLAVKLLDAEVSITIIDPCNAMTAIAKEKSDRIRIINSYAENLPIGEDSFDAIILRDSLHHITNQYQALSEITRVLKPGGQLLIQEFDPLCRLTHCLGLIERLLGETTTFMPPHKLGEILRSLDVHGESLPISRSEYIFTGCKNGVFIPRS